MRKASEFCMKILYRIEKRKEEHNKEESCWTRIYDHLSYMCKLTIQCYIINILKYYHILLSIDHSRKLGNNANKIRI